VCLIRSIHYVVTDASFRSSLVNWGLSRVGSIPKTKVMSDMESLRNIMGVKNQGGIIGIFPEGQSTWDGHTMPLVHSTAKLAKLLRVPVVTARIAGSYLSKPRWAKKGRRGRVTIRYDRAFTPGQLRTASPEEIDGRIAELLEHDEFEYNRKARVPFIGPDRAEYLERALFVCPSCQRVATLRSTGNEFGCTECGYKVHYSVYGLFQSRNGEIKFDNVRDWNLWQMEEFKRQLSEYIARDPEAPMLREDDVRVQIGYKSRPLAPFFNGPMELYADRIVLRHETGENTEFPVRGIRGENVQNNEHWEFYSAADLFRVTIQDPRGCTYKWDLAVKLIAASTD
jgi:DNA-directed RNA polymerase subunit RPC12/RpoP